MTNSLYKLITLTFLISVTSTFLYIYPSNLLTGEWVLDDKVSLLQNPLIVATPERGAREPLSALWYYDFWGRDRLDSSESHKSWRPFCTLSYRWNYDLVKDPKGELGFATIGGAVMSRKNKDNVIDWKEEATRLSYYFHLVDRVLHGCVSGLCVLVAWYTLMNHHNSHTSGWSWKWHATPLIAILFGSHPIHVESVANTTGRAEVLCALCFFIGFLVYAKMAVGIPLFRTGTATASPPLFKSMMGVFLTIVLTLCSMLCKEHGITLPIMCLIWDVLIATNTSLHEIYNCIFHHMVQSSHSHRGSRKNHKSKHYKHTNLHSPDKARLNQCLFLLLRAIILLVATIYMAIWRLFKNGKTSAPDLVCEQNPGACDPQFLNRFIHYSFVWCFNFWLLVCPSRLAPDWTGPSIDVVDVWKTLVGGDGVVSLFVNRLLPCALMWCCVGMFMFWAVYEAAIGVSGNDMTRGMVGSSNTSGRTLEREGSSSIKSNGKKKTVHATKNTPLQHTGSRHIVRPPGLLLWRRTIITTFSWMFLPFLMTSNLFVYIGLTIADRTLYLPSFGFCILLVQCVVGMCSILTQHKGRTTYTLGSIVSLVMVPILVMYISKQRHQTELWTESVTIWGEGYRVNPASIMGEREYGLSLVNSDRPADAAIVLRNNHKRALVNPWGDRTTRDAMLKRKGLTRSPFESNIRRWKWTADLLQSRFIFTTAMTNSGDCKDADSILTEGIQWATTLIEEIDVEERKLSHDAQSRQTLGMVKTNLMRERAALYVTYSKCANDLEIMLERTKLGYQSAPGHPQVLAHVSEVQKVVAQAQNFHLSLSQVKLSWKKTTTTQVAEFIIDPTG